MSISKWDVMAEERHKAPRFVELYDVRVRKVIAMPSRSLLPPKGRKKFRDEACEASRSHIHGRGIFSKLAASFKCCREPIGMLLLWMRNDYFQNLFLSYNKLRSLFHSAKDVDKSIPK